MAKPWKLQAVQSQKDKLWYVRLCGGNGEVVLRSKGYRMLPQAEALCDEVQAAQIDILPDEDTLRGSRITLMPHKGADGQWYNRLTVSSRDKMWSEGYARIDAAQRACRKARDAMVITLEPQAAAAPSTLQKRVAK